MFKIAQKLDSWLSPIVNLLKLGYLVSFDVGFLIPSPTMLLLLLRPLVRYVNM